MTKYLAFILALLAVVLTTSPAPVYAFSGSMTINGFVPGNGGAGPGGTQMPSGEARVMNGAIKTGVIVQAAGRQIAAEATMMIAKTAARRVAMGCFMVPDICNDAAQLAWVGLSRLMLNDEGDGWVKEQDQYGPCYTHRLGKDGNGNLDRCRSSAQEAVNAHISFLNTGINNQWEEANYTNSRVWTGNVRNMCTPALNSSCSPWFQYVTTRCPKSGGDCYDVTGEDQETISRLADQLTIVEVPAVESDFATHGTVHDEMPDEVAQKSPVPLEVESPKLVPIAEPIGEPYPGDDTPEKGPWKQDRLVYKDNPLTSNPTDVEAVPETVPVDNPTTPDIDEGPDTPPEDPDTPPEQEEQPSLCEEHPDISACAELGEIDDEDVPREDVSLEYESEDFGLPSGCPPDVQLGYNGAVFSFGPLCEMAPVIRAVVVALAGFVALGICAAALRGAT